MSKHLLIFLLLLLSCQHALAQDTERALAARGNMMMVVLGLVLFAASFFLTLLAARLLKKDIGSGLLLLISLGITAVLAFAGFIAANV